MEIKELEHALEGFSGSLELHAWSGLYPRFVLTDGAEFLADQAKAYWLMDLIASYQTKLVVALGEFFQCWTLEVYPDHSAVVACTDGNEHELVRQVVPYTDFPLETTRVWAVWDGDYLILMLPGEY